MYVSTAVTCHSPSQHGERIQSPPVNHLHMRIVHQHSLRQGEIAMVQNAEYKGTIAPGICKVSIHVKSQGSIVAAAYEKHIRGNRHLEPCLANLTQDWTCVLSTQIEFYRILSAIETSKDGFFRSTITLSHRVHPASTMKPVRVNKPCHEQIRLIHDTSNSLRTFVHHRKTYSR